MEKHIAIAIIVAVVLIILIYIIKTHNKFVQMKNRIADQKAQIDVQLKRRYDLIPNLVETAKGCANFEKSTLEAVVQARANALNAKDFGGAMSANENLTATLHRFIAVGESYPELKANNNFTRLQDELSDSEDKIAKTRQFFNDAVLKYNNAIQVFPANIVAGIFSYKKYEYFEISEAERENVRVSF